MIDLVCLVADRNMEAVVTTLLAMHHALGIRAIQTNVFPHPQHDPGCFASAVPFLRVLRHQAHHAFVILDRSWDGVPNKAPEELEAEVDGRLAELGPGWAKSIVIDPELEAWLFTRSPRLDDALGWRGRVPDLASELASRELWPATAAKPREPKLAIQWALSRVGKQKSSSIYRTIVENLGLGKCSDHSFLRFKSTLQTWFPVT